MTTIFIDNEPLFLEGPPGAFVPLAEVDALQAQIAALTADNATLQMEIEAANIAAGEWEETAAALAAERDGLRALVERTIKAGSELFSDPNLDPHWHWKDYLMDLDKIIVDGRKALGKE